MDPTLPRINTIKCPNQACKSNEGHGHGQEVPRQQKSKSASRSESGSGSGKLKASSSESSPEEPEAVEVLEEQEGGAPTDREIIYLRYDDVNMNFVYLCPVCDSVWNTTQ
jgi:hypothetical protein